VCAFDLDEAPRAVFGAFEVDHSLVLVYAAHGNELRGHERHELGPDLSALGEGRCDDPGVEGGNERFGRRHGEGLDVVVHEVPECGPAFAPPTTYLKGFYLGLGFVYEALA